MQKRSKGINEDDGSRTLCKTEASPTAIVPWLNLFDIIVDTSPDLSEELSVNEDGTFDYLKIVEEFLSSHLTYAYDISRLLGASIIPNSDTLDPMVNSPLKNKSEFYISDKGNNILYKDSSNNFSSENVQLWNIISKKEIENDAQSIEPYDYDRKSLDDSSSKNDKFYKWLRRRPSKNIENDKYFFNTYETVYTHPQKKKREVREINLQRLPNYWNYQNYQQSNKKFNHLNKISNKIIKNELSTLSPYWQKAMSQWKSRPHQHHNGIHNNVTPEKITSLINRSQVMKSSEKGQNSLYRNIRDWIIEPMRNFPNVYNYPIISNHLDTPPGCPPCPRCPDSYGPPSFPPFSPGSQESSGPCPPCPPCPPSSQAHIPYPVPSPNDKHQPLIPGNPNIPCPPCPPCPSNRTSFPPLPKTPSPIIPYPSIHPTSLNPFLQCDPCPPCPSFPLYPCPQYPCPPSTLCPSSDLWPTFCPPSPSWPSSPSWPASPTWPSSPSWLSSPSWPSLPTWPSAPAWPPSPSWPSSPSWPGSPTWQSSPSWPASPSWPSSHSWPSSPSWPASPTWPSSPSWLPSTLWPPTSSWPPHSRSTSEPDETTCWPEEDDTSTTCRTSECTTQDCRTFTPDSSDPETTCVPFTWETSCATLTSEYETTCEAIVPTTCNTIGPATSSSIITLPTFSVITTETTGDVFPTFTAKTITVPTFTVPNLPSARDLLQSVTVTLPTGQNFLPTVTLPHEKVSGKDIVSKVVTGGADTVSKAVSGGADIISKAVSGGADIVSKAVTGGADIVSKAVSGGADLVTKALSTVEPKTDSDKPAARSLKLNNQLRSPKLVILPDDKPRPMTNRSKTSLTQGSSKDVLGTSGEIIHRQKAQQLSRSSSRLVHPIKTASKIVNNHMTNKTVKSRQQIIKLRASKKSSPVQSPLPQPLPPIKGSQRPLLSTVSKSLSSVQNYRVSKSSSGKLVSVTSPNSVSSPPKSKTTNLQSHDSASSSETGTVNAGTHKLPLNASRAATRSYKLGGFDRFASDSYDMYM